MALKVLSLFAGIVVPQIPQIIGSAILATLSEAGLKSADRRDEVEAAGQTVGLTHKIPGRAA